LLAEEYDYFGRDDMPIEFVSTYAFWGAVGGFAAILVKQGCFELPSIKDKKLYLGSGTGILLGAIAGLIGDSNWFNSLMWGMGGSAIISGLVALAEKKADEITKEG
jgi:hypothetical protein